MILTMAEAILFNVSLDYAWFLILPTDNEPISCFIYKRKHKGNDITRGSIYLQGVWGSSKILTDEQNQIITLYNDNATRLANKDWKDMLNYIEQLDTFK